MKRIFLVTAVIGCSYSLLISGIYAKGGRLKSTDPGCKKQIALCTSKLQEWHAAYETAEGQQRSDLVEISDAVRRGCIQCLGQLEWYNEETGRRDGCGVKETLSGIDLCKINFR
jgi:hypothetical protein